MKLSLIKVSLYRNLNKLKPIWPSINCLNFLNYTVISNTFINRILYGTSARILL